MKVGSRITMLTAAICVAGCVAQLDPEQCSSEYIHHVAPAPVDLGNGLTVQEQNHRGYFNPSDYWGAERLVITNCATGRWVRLERSVQNDSGEDVRDHRAAVSEMIETAKRLPADEAIEFLIKESERQGILLASGTSDQEDCACQAFYPELRGDKTTYEASQ